MRIGTLVIAVGFLLGCGSNLGQYSHNYQNNSLYGAWDEVGAAEVNELILKKDGNFSFTALPFETYKDYWGTYSVDSKHHMLNFIIKGGNNVPKDVQLQRVEYAFDKSGHLILNNYYYGTVSKKSKYGLRHIFKRYP